MKRKKRGRRAPDAPPGKPGGRSTAPPPSRCSNAPPDPPPPAGNATATHRPSSPATPQETTSGVQTRSGHLQIGTITIEQATILPAISDLPVYTPTPPTNNSSDATRQPQAGRSPHVVKPMETTSSAPGNSSSSRSTAEVQPPGSTPSSRPRSSDGTRSQPQDPSSPRRISSAPKLTETTKYAISVQGNSSNSPATLPGITTASLRSSSSGAKPPRQHNPSTARRSSPSATPHTANLTSPQGNSTASRSPQQSPRSGQIWVAKESSSLGPAQGNSPGSSSPHSGKALAAKKPSPTCTPAVAHDVQSGPTGSAGKNNSAGGKVDARYDLRPRHVSPVQHKPTAARPESASQSVTEPPPLEHPAATPPNPSDPSTQRRRSSLTINDDTRTKKLYLQYLQKHEKPNAIMLLLSGKPFKFSVNFRKLLRWNRALAHTICNNKDRIWSLLLETTRTFLSQQFNDFNIRAQVEGLSDERIENDLLNLELVFEDLPFNICTLLDFLDSTTLTVIEDILEGHKILVPSDEGRRLLHALVAYLIAHHKEGKAWGGEWKKEDWDVEDSRTVSLSKEPRTFTDAAVPAKDMSRLGSSVVPHYRTRGHLNTKPKQKLSLLFVESFMKDLGDRSGLTTEDYHELMCSHPFIMPSESRSDLLFALYHFFKTFNWEFNMDYDSVFADLGLRSWKGKIIYGDSRVLKKVFWFGWDRRNPNHPYNAGLGHLLVFDRHALEHIRNHEQLIRKMIQLELLVSSRSSRFLPRVIRLMFQHGKMVGEMRRRWDIYVGDGANKRL